VVILQKIFSELENLKSNDAERFFPQGAWHLEIEVLLTSFINVYIVSFKKLHKEAVDNKVMRQ